MSIGVSNTVEEKTLASIRIDSEKLQQAFDRRPIGFSHTLHKLSLLSLESLHGLAQKMADTPRDYFIAMSAAEAGSKFFSVPMAPCSAPEAIENLDRGGYRILLKRAENHDSGFRDLIDTLFEQVVDSVEGLSKQKVVRLESGILITSSATITPFHYDEEIGFFSQIEGDKIYHVYAPTAVHEQEVERFSVHGGGILAPLELEGRDPALEYVFNLKAGEGFHQPRRSPHWVETKGTRSISYTFVFETEATRAEGRTRAFNGYMRRVGLTPASMGTHPTLERIKSDVMRSVLPLRQKAASFVNKIRHR